MGMLVSDSLTYSLTDSCLVNLIDVKLACGDDNSRLVEVVNPVLKVCAHDAHVQGTKQVWGDQKAGGPENLLLIRFES